MGPDYRRDNRSTPCGAAHRDTESPAGALRMGATAKRTNYPTNPGSCGPRSWDSNAPVGQKHPAQKNNANRCAQKYDTQGRNQWTALGAREIATHCAIEHLPFNDDSGLLASQLWFPQS